MDRLRWPVALVLAFLVGWAAAGLARKSAAPLPAVGDRDELVSRLEQQVSTLQARLRARETAGAAQTSATTTQSEPSASSRSNRRAAAAIAEERLLADIPFPAVGPAPPRSRTPTDNGATRGASRPTPGGPAPTVEVALERFYKYLDVAGSAEGRERWQRTRELLQDLRGMGDAGAQALMQVLAAKNDSEERRLAARLLGNLQAPQALPALSDIIEHEDDVLLRRAAASALRQLQSPESMPVMERILANPSEDRFVRLSAAYGLAESGRPLGVTGLTQIFDESTADGRGREMAFRALASLNDERSLPFMRQVVASQLEPSYRLQAIRYVTAQGDQQALPTLQVLMNSPREQASIRDAAAQAYTTISGR